MAYILLIFYFTLTLLYISFSSFYAFYFSIYYFSDLGFHLLFSYQIREVFDQLILRFFFYIVPLDYEILFHLEPESQMSYTSQSLCPRKKTIVLPLELLVIKSNIALFNGLKL